MALSLDIMSRYGDFRGIVHLHVDPIHFESASHYLQANQALALFSKNAEFKVPGIDRKQKAIEKWYDAEQTCYRSNQRLNHFVYNSFESSDEAIFDFIVRVRKKIQSWIGSSPPSHDSLQGRFGPGATYSDRGRLTTVPDKMSSVPTLTPNAFWYIIPYLGTMWGRNNASIGKGLEYVRGNRFTTVPKNYKTDRGIAIEPAINVFYQLGLGTAIRDRLRLNTGWDLNHVQSLHVATARASSLDEKFATLDLASASDTVCSSLVKLLLPPAWYEELDALRSPYTFIEGKWVQLEKFSSMGNGYTFELETLIFAAISSAWLEESGHQGLLGHDLFVYGDDIIVPTNVSRSLVSILSFFGFTTNKEKSFHTGPFRESCGGDFWLGMDVRPWFLKLSLSDPMLMMQHANGFRAYQQKASALGTTISEQAWWAFVKEIPLPYRNFTGPSELGDICLHTDESRWKYRWKDSIRLFRTVAVRSSALPWHHWRPEIVLASAVLGIGDGLLGVIPRDPPRKYRQQWAAYS